METIWEGRLVGAFHGYKGGRVFELSDGSKWEQQDGTDEPVYRHSPTARLARFPASPAVYLDVEGTSAMVRVVKPGGRFRTNAGAV
ncbi:hypothetical protein [Paludisphaera mucosa]|uniref:Uncharacterized protein n=1 Tax=Paludisphaera mucosa TaxID=3030827 RepID=A0ABT6F3U5_9BACT|nr:hypothetical protein [Paludisphaera mucosa]MDG3002247.1 hypothetical protein [Paludisphaera mucosa]